MVAWLLCCCLCFTAVSVASAVVSLCLLVYKKPSYSSIHRFSFFQSINSLACGCVALGGAALSGCMFGSDFPPGAPQPLGHCYSVTVGWVVGLHPLRGRARLVGLWLCRAPGLVAQLRGLWHLGLRVWRPAQQPTLLAPLLLRPVPLACCLRVLCTWVVAVAELRFHSVLPFAALDGGSALLRLRRRLSLGLAFALVGVDWLSMLRRSVVGRGWLSLLACVASLRLVCVCLGRCGSAFCGWFRRCGSAFYVGSVSCWSWVGGWSLGSTSTASLWRPFHCWRAAFHVGAFSLLACLFRRWRCAPLGSLLTCGWVRLCLLVAGLGVAFHFGAAFVLVRRCWLLGWACCWSLDSAWVVGCGCAVPHCWLDVVSVVGGVELGVGCWSLVACWALSIGLVSVVGGLFGDSLPLHFPTLSPCAV